MVNMTVFERVSSEFSKSELKPPPRRNNSTGASGISAVPNGAQSVETRVAGIDMP